jgi:DNA-binding IclR family transcriptional regulator
VIQSVDRAMRILAVLQGRRMSLGEIASRLGLAPSTAHGIVRTLLGHGMVVQEPDSGHYRLGPATLRLGNIYLDTLELRARVAGWAPELARRTGCAVRAGVPLLDDVVVVAHEPRPDGTRQMPEVGIVIPAHACALGKALLAFGAAPSFPGPSDTLHSMTAETITDRSVLAATLARVRATGVAPEVEEAVIGECGIAAPLADATGLVGAIGLVTPVSGWPLPDTAVDALRDTARAVSRELGATAWPPAVSEAVSA